MFRKGAAPDPGLIYQVKRLGTKPVAAPASVEAKTGRQRMHYSTDRILVTHAGSLPRPADLRAMVLAKSAGEPYDAVALDRRLGEAVAETVRRQQGCGIDVVNDGELSKYNFTDYVRLRIAGYETRASTGRRRLSIIARDEKKFAGYFAANPRTQSLGPPTMPVCVAKLRYVGQAELR